MPQPMYLDTEQLYAYYQQHPRLCTDTRRLQVGDLFLALRGPNFDANAFASQALAAGAAYVIVDDPLLATTGQHLLVQDGLRALQALAAHHRRQWGRWVIGLTGSNGKTTTKELLASILAEQLPLLATPGNWNNHIGLPLTLLQLTPAHQLALLEMGDNKTGDIAELCQIADPDWALITNIGEDHLQGYAQGMAGNAATKRELFDYVAQKGGRLFINLDDPWLAPAARLADTTYGQAGQYRISQLGQDAAGQQLLLEYPEGQLPLQTVLPGNHNAENVLLAATVALELGVPPTAIQSGVACYHPHNNRSQWKNLKGKQVLLDAYNANPTSMRAALDTFLTLAQGASLLVLGDMLELGPEEAAAHSRLGQWLATRLAQHQHPVQLLLVGPAMAQLLPYLPGAAAYPDASAARQAFIDLWAEAEAVFLKGSRGLALERLIAHVDN